MTREQSIQELDLKYSPLLSQLQDAVGVAQSNLSQAQAVRNELYRQINEYYDALDSKVLIDAVIAKGVPDSKTINDSASAFEVI